jgi:BRCT domain, a BRCA1 C-terminus domain
MAEGFLFDGCLMFVLYVPEDAAEAVPQRQSLIGAITAYGGTLISRREVIQVQFADKVTVLAVNRHALPRKLPLLPGTCVYDGSWVFDSIKAGAMLPLEDYELLDGPAGLPEKQGVRHKAAPKEQQRAVAAAPPQEEEEAPVDAAAPGVEAEEREDGEAPKRKRCVCLCTRGSCRGQCADSPGCISPSHVQVHRGGG